VNAEVLTIGSEILRGLVRDTNFEMILARLAEVGIAVTYHTSVEDDSERIGEALRVAAHRARFVIVTGGLGPTPDDLTRKTIATVFRRRLILDEGILDHLRARFRERGIEMPALNEAQALVPRGAKVIENPRGTAPGLHFTVQETDVFALPGVPAEAEAMMVHYVAPYVRERAGGVRIGRRVVRTIGVPESALAQALAGFEVEEDDVRLGYLPHTGGVDLYLTAASADATWLEQLLDRCERTVAERAGAAVYGRDGETLAEVVGRTLAERGLTIATGESFTAGALGAAITAVPGSSRYFLGGVIAYANEAKQELLAVPGELLRSHGAVSAEVAESMAIGARERFGSAIGLSTTGIAGPEGGSEEKPVGLAYLGIAFDGGAKVERFQFGGTRFENVSRAGAYALDLARRHVGTLAAWSEASSRS
jgi:competence/damage-inducible protein CinA-like protein